MRQSSNLPMGARLWPRALSLAAAAAMLGTAGPQGGHAVALLPTLLQQLLHQAAAGGNLPMVPSLRARATLAPRQGPQTARQVASASLHLPAAAGQPRPSELIC